MELTGKIKLINDIQTFDSGFSKREFVITTEEQYPQDIKLELVKDKCSILDNYQPGNAIKVSFNIRGNEYQGKYFVNLQAWRIENASSTNASTEPAGVNENFSISPETNDLPF